MIVKVQDITELVSLCLWSCYISDERPVSCFIAAKPEAGKTEILKRFMDIPGVLYTNDLTAYGLVNYQLDNILSGKVKTLIIPDFITPLSRSSETVDTFISFLNGLIEEGIVRSFTYATRVDLATGVRINLCTAVTKDIIGDRRRRWSRIGFMTRVLPISYDYTTITQEYIRDSIARGLPNLVDPVVLQLPVNPVEVELTRVVGDSLALFVPLMINQQESEDAIYGFRLQRQLQTLCKAHALSHGRDRCLPEDFEHIIYLSRYINLRYTKI